MLGRRVRSRFQFDSRLRTVIEADDDRAESERLQDALNLFFGDRILILSGSYQELDDLGDNFGDPRTFSTAGFILACAQYLLFVTCGHLIREIRDLTDNPHRRWLGLAWSHCVVDSPTERTISMDNTIPRRTWHQCDVVIGENCRSISGGTDWGVILLSETESRWIRDAGVQIFSPEELQETTAPDDHAHILMGLPRALFGPVTTTAEGVTREIDPTIMSLVLDKTLMDAHHNAWIIGRPPPDELGIGMLGMSGGPLFAIDYDQEGFPYWIVGIQSHWCPANRVSFVCPIGTILDGIRGTDLLRRE
jgi:hypothetical protein